MTVHLKLDTGDYRYFNGIVSYFAKTGNRHGSEPACVVNLHGIVKRQIGLGSVGAARTPQ
jgi:hypothetical protein